MNETDEMEEFFERLPWLEEEFESSGKYWNTKPPSKSSTNGSFGGLSGSSTWISSII